MLHTLAIHNYRSLRDLLVPLRRMNVITGPNGSGKSNIYRALRLLADIVQGRAIASLALEGGLASALWAGPEAFARAMLRREQPVQATVRKGPVSLRLGFAGDEYGYAIDLGLPAPSRSAFARDPEIKRECVWNGPVLGPAAIPVDRKGPLVQSRGERGEWTTLTQRLATFDSMMTHCADPRHTPELLLLRERIRGWRFYDHFRSDASAPARAAQIATRTPVLSDSGADLAAAVQTIVEIGDAEALAAAIDDAFPGATVAVVQADGRFELEMQQEGLLRGLRAAELSDGTLRYLLWVAALLTPRPPPLLVLNEPETSLHADLLPALGRLIASAAARTQVMVVSHASRLITSIEDAGECESIVLEKHFGETHIANAATTPHWQWPGR